MAYFFGLNEKSCIAENNIDMPLPSESSMEGSDVASRFRMAIRWGFWMSLINFLRASLAQVAFYWKKWVLLLISYAMFAINIAVLIILFVLMQLWRWQHSGRVCSGDYLTDITDEDKESYLITEGKFIKVVLYITYIFIGLFGLAVCILGVCSAATPSKSANVDEEGALVKKPTSIFDAAVDQHTAEVMRDRRESFAKAKS